MKQECCNCCSAIGWCVTCEKHKRINTETNRVEPIDIKWKQFRLRSSSVVQWDLMCRLNCSAVKRSQFVMECWGLERSSSVYCFCIRWWHNDINQYRRQMITRTITHKARDRNWHYFVRWETLSQNGKKEKKNEISKCVCVRVIDAKWNFYLNVCYNLQLSHSVLIFLKFESTFRDFEFNQS